MSVKLTDAQLVMMSSAAQREDRCLAAPETMKGAVVSKAGAKLVKLGFAREIHAKSGSPLWRRDETGRSFALKLTAAGLKAMAVDERPQVAIEPGEASQPQLLPEAKNGVSLDDVGRHETPWTRDGTVRAYVVTMAPEVAGRIVELPVADNQFVYKGDLLLEIDPTNYTIAVSQAEAAVQQAQASIQNIDAQNPKTGIALVRSGEVITACLTHVAMLAAASEATSSPTPRPGKLCKAIAERLRCLIFSAKETLAEDGPPLQVVVSADLGPIAGPLH